MAESPMAELMLEAAQRDAVVFFKLVGDTGVHDSMLGFHAQQSVAKALKAVLFKRGVLVPRTHHIDALLDVLREAFLDFPPHAVHQMVLGLERLGFIERTPGQGRSLKLRLTREQLPDLV